ncbi:MAG TPA: PepSY-associated TM helix domain-containing protein [Ideonella sp.]|uniref:PepSY-associated TM helix domain-containing protein n=1 Tax=Ideonella sp. TaxID=1929293 RepID=UPI002BA37FE9|nr:PepSY-associated TM helix domain-containing protein [Ideonella sp.]HSI48761.1 PepSY-associated TM helix domain-containing protein [Ideonella sp.]
MKTSTLRGFLALHTWVGLASGLLLFIAFYAGAFTLFHHQLEDWERQPAATAHALAATPDTTPADALATAQRLLDSTLAAHPAAAEDLRLWLPGEHAETPTLYWYENGTASGRQTHILTLDAHGALAEQPELPDFAGLVYRLHYTAGLPAQIGIYLFGFVCVLYGVALVSGVVIYMPTFLRDLFALRAGRNIKRYWQDAHNVVGLLSLPFHVIFAWSGAVLCIGLVMLAPFQFLVFDGKLLQVVQPEIDPTPVVEPAKTAAPLQPVTALVASARQQIPGLVVERLYIQHAGDAKAQVTVEGDTPQGALNARSAVVLDGVTAAPRRVFDPNRQSPGQAFMYGLFALHFGDFGGAALRWLYSALGLAGAFLFYSGNLLWVEARRRHHAPVQRSACIRMAQLTLGVSLGCCAGIAAMAWAARLVPLLTGQPAGEALMPSYLAVFGLMVLWALLRAPSHGARELLWLTAGLHAAVPLLELLDLQRATPAAADGATRLAVSGIALLLATGFALAARQVQQRAQTGDRHSVWAAPQRVAETASAHRPLP